MRCPILNPLKFYDSTAMPNWTTRFPQNDNITQRTEYIIGQNPAQYYKEFLSNKTIYLQFEYEVGDSLQLTLKKYNEATFAFDTVTVINPTDISPSGWVGSKIYSYSYLLTTGTYYFVFADGFRSDTFVVISDLELSKRLIEVKYSHAENDYGCIFDNSYQFINYFQGQLIEDNAENEYAAYETDRGEQIKLQATPKRVYTLNINEIHKTYIAHLNMIFSLDTIFVNGVEFENIDSPQTEQIEFSDLFNAVIKLYLVGNDYFYKR